MKAIKFLIGLFFIFIVIMLGTANNEEVSLNIWVGKPLLGYQTTINPTPVPSGDGAVEPSVVRIPNKVSLWKIIIVCLGFGFFLCYVMNLQDSFDLKAQLRRSRKMLEKAEEELQSLRSSAPAPPVSSGNEPTRSF